MTSSNATLTPSNWALEDAERQVLDNLLVDELTRGLGAAEAEELQLLLHQAEAGQGSDDEKDTEDLLEDLHQVVAITELGLIERQRHQVENSAPPPQMPDTVEADLRALAKVEAKRLAPGNFLPFEQATI